MPLLLSRYANELIVVISPSGEQVVMKAESVDRGQVSLRNETPADYQVWKEELLEQIWMDELLERDGRRLRGEL